MYVNNFLIIGVNPANNETGVATNSTVTVEFSTDMDVTTLNSGTLVLRKVNGSILTYTIEYVNISRKVVITPSAPLESGTQYQLQVVGGTEGIKSVTGEYLSESRTYEFTTSYEVLLSPPTLLSVSTSNGYPTVSWSQPNEYDPALALSYEVMISSSSLATDPPLWPSTGDVNITGGTTLNVPKQFGDGNYYAYVRAINSSGTSSWASHQFSITTSTTDTSPTTSSLFEVSEVYPRQDAVDITPEKIYVVFTSNIDATSISSDTFYVIPKAKTRELTLIDFLTDFAPSKRIEATIDTIVSPTNIITLTPALDAIQDDMEYTVIVRESVKSATAETLGEAYAWSFMSNFSILYGDAQSIRDDIGSIIRYISDKVLYKYMRDISRYAYDVVSRRSDFDPAEYEGGKAPYYVHQYVRLQTGYDLLLNAHIHSSGGSGNSIRLGDLQVDKSSSSSDISSLLRSTKDKIKPWQDLLHGHHNRGYAKPTVAVKGETGAAYPDFLTRAEYRELGQ